MTAGASAAPTPAARGGFDPLRWAWNLLTNVKFAVVLVGTAAAVSLIGVVLPQLPAAARQTEAAQEAWLETQRAEYGRFTDLLWDLGFFDVFHATWFNALWLLVIVAVTVCTVSRFRPTWRAVHRPQRTVNPRYFETAHHRAEFSHGGGVEAVRAELRKRRYRVEDVGEADGERLLFAERFAWTHYGTFLSHLALLMLLVGALLTRFAGFDTTLVVAETAPGAPVFQEPGPGQIFVTTVDAQKGVDADGNIVDFRTYLELRRGEETVSCVTTVNDPCEQWGYRFHQAAFFDDFARMVITGPGGQVLFDDVLDFESRSNVVPHLRVTAPDGAVLFDQVLPQMGTDTGVEDGPEDDLATASLAFPAAEGTTEAVAYAVAWGDVDGEVVVTLVGRDLAPIDLNEGETATSAEGGYRFEYVTFELIPAARLLDVPGAVGEATVVQMPTDGAGNPYLYISGIDQQNVAIEVGQTATTPAGYRYTFEDKVDGSGINIRRDPGDTFIWVAVGMAVVGLSITFYVPRRRLWVRVTPGRTYLAGIAEKTTRFAREMRFIGASLGSEDALEAGDLERD